MAKKNQNLADYLNQPGQTVAALMREFNKERVRNARARVSACTFYSWCRGDSIPTKHWDMMTLSNLTGIPSNKLFAFAQ